MREAVDRNSTIRYIEGVSLFCLCVLVGVLPIAHTESIRSFALGIPAFLLLVKMGIRRKWLFSRTPLDLPLLLFSIVGGLSILTAVDPRYSLEEFIGEWGLGVFLFYLSVASFQPRHLKYLLGALLLGNLVMNGYGIWNFFDRGGTFFSYQIRAGSLHSGFGTFSTYLITLMPYLLLSLFFVPSKRARWGLSLLLFINIGALYLTHARGAWVAAALLIGGVGWMFFSRRIFLAFIIGGAAILFFFLSQGTWQHHVDITPPGSRGKVAIETGAARWELLKFTMTQLKENPFQMIGYGRGSFVKKYREFSDQYKGALLWHAHNTFLNVALQTGIQGLVIFLFLVYKILAFSYRQGKCAGTPEVRYFLLATFSMVIVYFVRNLSDDFFVDDSALLLWLLVGVAVRISPGEPAAAHHPGFPRKLEEDPTFEVQKREGRFPVRAQEKGLPFRKYFHGNRLSFAKMGGGLIWR